MAPQLKNVIHQINCSADDWLFHSWSLEGSGYQTFFFSDGTLYSRCPLCGTHFFNRARNPHEFTFTAGCIFATSTKHEQSLYPLRINVNHPRIMRVTARIRRYYSTLESCGTPWHSLSMAPSLRTTALGVGEGLIWGICLDSIYPEQLTKFLDTYIHGGAYNLKTSMYKTLLSLIVWQKFTDDTVKFSSGSITSICNIENILEIILQLQSFLSLETSMITIIKSTQLNRLFRRHLPALEGVHPTTEYRQSLMLMLTSRSLLLKLIPVPLQMKQWPLSHKTICLSLLFFSKLRSKISRWGERQISHKLWCGCWWNSTPTQITTDWEEKLDTHSKYNLRDYTANTFSLQKCMDLNYIQLLGIVIHQ